MLTCFPLRCEWEALHPAQAPPWPAPVFEPVPARPAPVDDLVRWAEVLGWIARVTYSRGHVPHATHGTPSAAPKAIWAVRLARDNRRAVAVREDGSWHSLWVWSDSIFFTRLRLLDEFKSQLI